MKKTADSVQRHLFKTYAMVAAMPFIAMFREIAVRQPARQSASQQASKQVSKQSSNQARRSTR